MNQSPTAEDTTSNASLSTPSPGGMNLSDIPVFTASSTKETNHTPFSAPSSFDDGKVEYEFTCIFTDSRPMFCGLWDTDDLSACQRISACKMDRDEIVYDKDTGVGFFKTVDGLRWCFKKQPIQKSYGPFNPIVAGEEPAVRTPTADDILSEL